jgi:3-phenylpropionate/trans-cinnamate dioxygenase ferredoxin subunit
MSRQRVARLADVPPGALLAVTTADGERICLVNLGDDGADEVHAVHDGCTHQAFPLSAGELLPDGSIECPWHGARFDCRTGAVCAGPACEPVRVYEVEVADGEVYVTTGAGRADERVEGRGSRVD